MLASVYETAGSTYSKCGAQMLINADGDFQGMLSGGCLEGDLAERAKTVLNSGHAQSVTYDLSVHDEALWDLGVGCDGLMRIFLQPLQPDSDYEPFATIAKVIARHSEQVIATVVESRFSSLAAGASIVFSDGSIAYCSVAQEIVNEFNSVIEKTLSLRQSSSSRISNDVVEATVLCSFLKPSPSILVLGAGLDAEPVVQLALGLGWRVTVQDHRPAYIEAGNFDGSERLICVPVNEISTVVDLDDYAATIVMSHHLVSDQQYLSQIAASHIPYVGLLGPVNRRQKLIRELGAAATNLEGRLHGPAGIDIGGRGPASIALSIVAGMHHEFSRAEII